MVTYLESFDLLSLLKPELGFRREGMYDDLAEGLPLHVLLEHFYSHGDTVGVLHHPLWM
jgi:hypothetical protein